MTAPYGLVGSAVNLGTLLVLAAYPTSAALYRDSVEAFHQSRRNMAVVLLAGGLTTAVIGSLFARPLVLLIFGHEYTASVPVLASLAWYIPLRLMRMLYATSLVASSFQRLHPLGALAEAFVALIVAYPAVHLWGATGAAITLLVGELANVCVTLWLVSLVQHSGLLSRMETAPRVN
jgi:O-antigen/teichoic acid export membrane protein